MFYIDKDKNVIELIYSEQGICIVIDQKDSLSGDPKGRIIRKGKKELKKTYKKASKKRISVKPITEDQKKNIIDLFLTDKIGILKYTDDYISGSNKIERKEYFENLTEQEYEKSLKELADTKDTTDE